MAPLLTFLLALAFMLASVRTSTIQAMASPHWSQFRGPNCSGIAENQQPPTEFGPATNYLWKTSVPQGLSSPCIWEDHVFLTGLESDRLVTLAFDRRSGKQLWKQVAPVTALEKTHQRGSPASATPACDGERLYVYFASYGLLSYDFHGREQWRKPLSNVNVLHGSGTSPALIQGKLILNCDQEDSKSFLLALNPKEGQILWQTPRPDFDSSYSTPVGWHRDGWDEIVVEGTLRVVSYDWRTGKERWFIRGTEGNGVCPTPVIGDGQLYIASFSFGGMRIPLFDAQIKNQDVDGDGRLSLAEKLPPMPEAAFHNMDKNKDGFLTKDEMDPVLAIINSGEHGIFAVRAPVKEDAGDLTSSHVVWKQKKGVPQVPSPLFYQGKIYAVQDGGRVTCWNAKDGQVIYEQERLGAQGDYWASPVAANGAIYFSSAQGTVCVIEPGNSLQVKSRNEIGEPIFTTPAIATDNFYIRTDQHLWAFGSNLRKD